MQQFWSRGSEQGLFPGREESERRSFAGARQFADSPGYTDDREKDEEEEDFDREKPLRAIISASDPPVVASYEIAVDVFGEVEVNLEPEQAGLSGPSPSGVEASIWTFTERC
jgi:hypothetical protein